MDNLTTAAPGWYYVTSKRDDAGVVSTCLHPIAAWATDEHGDVDPIIVSDAGPFMVRALTSTWGDDVRRLGPMYLGPLPAEVPPRYESDRAVGPGRATPAR